MTKPRWEIEILVTDQEPTHLVTLFGAKRMVVEEFELPTEQIHSLLDEIDGQDLTPKEVETVLFKLEEKIKKSEKESNGASEARANKKYAKAILDSKWSRKDNFDPIRDPDLLRRNLEQTVETGQFTDAQLNRLFSSMVSWYEARSRHRHGEEPAELPQHLQKYIQR
jgi:hypothetical protein